MKDYRTLAYRYLWKNKTRTILTIFSVALGVAALAVMAHLSETYFQNEFRAAYIKNPQSFKGSFGTFTVVYYCFCLLVAFIFAILCVGVVRNTLSLTILEQIKDLQMLRCVGGTGKQLKGIVYRCGFFLEGIGLLVGYIAGFPITLFAAEKLKIDPIFSFGGLGLIAIAFLGDLFFAVSDITKMIMRMTPADAVRGEYKLGKGDVLKATKKSIWGLLFGVSGDYAWKNLKRNPKRFRTMVFVVSFAAATVIVSVGIESNINRLFYENLDYMGGKYQVLMGMHAPRAGIYPEEVRNSSIMPSEDVLRGLFDSKHGYAKRAYGVTLMMADGDDISRHLVKNPITDQWKESYQSYKNYILHKEEKLQEVSGEDLELRKNIIGNLYELMAGKNVWGYDEEDYKALKPYLVEGTLELSENGIIAIEGARVSTWPENIISGGTFSLDEIQYVEVQFLDYSVGDEVTFIDYVEFMKKIRKKMANMRKPFNADETDYLPLVGETYEECLKEKKFRTYVVEGVLSRDCNRSGIYYDYREIDDSFILPLDRFFTEFHHSEDMNFGYFYHFNGHTLDPAWMSYARQMFNDENFDIWSDYLFDIYEMQNMQTILAGILAFVVFVVTLQLLNIFNSTISNLYLRRKEFAQLCVIGMSQRHLYMTVMLEGVIVTICSAVLGGVLSYGGYILITKLLGIGFEFPVRYPWEMIPMTAVIILLLLCGIIFLGVRNRTSNNVEELSGEGW